MTYPLSSPVVEGQATEANQYNYLRQDALYLGGDPAASGTVRDLLYSSYGDLPLSSASPSTIVLSASDSAPAALMIGGVAYAVRSNLTLALSSVDMPNPGRYTIYAAAGSDGSFSLALVSSNSSRAIGSFLWDGSGVIPGTVHNLRELQIMQLANTPAAAHGRLTLVAGDPCPDSDITMGDYLYFVPYKGNRIGLYLYGAWEYFDFSLLSLGKSGLTAGIPYDVFLSADSDGLKLSVSAWVAVGSRASGLLAWQDGVRVFSADHSKRFLGSFVINSNGYFEDSQTGRLLWNENNRLTRTLLKKISTTKTQGTNHMNAWFPYYDDEAPQIRLLVSTNDTEFELNGIGISSPISESDRGYYRLSAVGIIQDCVMESPYTGNEPCSIIGTHNFGNGPVISEVENNDPKFQGYHSYTLGFYANYSFYPAGTNNTNVKMLPGLYGKILA